MRHLTTDQFKLMRRGSDRELIVVNTLPEDQFDQTKIPGSLNIPFSKDDFVHRVEEEIGGREMPVVLYCASAQCDSSSRAAQHLEDRGFSNVYDYEGGAEAWKQAGGEVGTAVS